MEYNDEADVWEREELDGMDLEDQMEELMNEEDVDICPRCSNSGCNYCLMLSY